jgi:hypothetical protein
LPRFRQAFRRPDSPFETARFRLRGLAANRSYVTRNAVSTEVGTLTGTELLERGLPIVMFSGPQRAG